jgi:hypothetical protein
VSEVAVPVPATRHSLPRAAVAAAVLVAAIVVTLALAWPRGGSDHVKAFHIPQRVIDQAAQERAAWQNLQEFIDEQQAAATCPSRGTC